MSRHTGSVLASILASVLATACAAQDDIGTLDENVGSWPKHPVVLVPGCAPPPLTNLQGSAVMFNFRDYFLAQGYPADYVNIFVQPGATCHSNVDVAVELGDFIDQVRAATGEHRVDVVAHSMGPVAARLYVLQGGNRYVDHFVQISAANHGSWIGQWLGSFQDIFGYPAYEAAKEMYPPYACEGESLGADVQFTLNGCIRASGRTVEQDETPFAFASDEDGIIKYLNIWNPLDEIIQPPQSSCLNQDFIGDCTDPVNEEWVVTAGPVVAHQKILSDPDVIARVYDFVTE